MKNNNSVAIIIATLNVKDCIEKCLDSCLNQSYSNIAIVVIDGGSTDGTLDLIKKYLNRISYFSTEPDNSIFEAWNKGLKNFNSDWYCFMGADDYWLSKDSISSLMRYSGNAGINLITSKIIPLSHKEPLLNQAVGKSFSAHNLYLGMRTPHPGMLHHHTLFIKYGYFIEDYKIAGDFEFLVRARAGIKSIYAEFPVICMGQLGLSNTKYSVCRAETSKILRVHLKFGYYYSLIYSIVFYAALLKRLIKNF